ncbi:MAG: response regulator transcription factor [Bacteroidota bacterium]
MIKIALVDDHHQVRETWQFILSTNKAFEVVAKCRNGQEAIEAARNFSPDVFLMDINMEPINGIEATETITRLYPNIKIVAMSIHMEAIYVKRMLQAGASAYVTKNSPYQEVFEAIMHVYEGRQYICNEAQRIPAYL